MGSRVWRVALRLGSGRSTICGTWGGETMMLLVLAAAAACVFLPVGGAAFAHPGGLNSEGCHNNRKTGEHHCHPGKPAAAPRPKTFATGASTPFASCSEARAAGAAPVHRGYPGYAPRLDRDGDGVGCE